MIASLRARWAHGRTAGPAAVAAPAPAEPRPQTLSANPFVLLVPTEGGMSFYLNPVPDLESARAAMRQLPASVRQKVITFQATQARPQADAGSGRPPEAVVMIRDAERPQIVQLSSFVDMESAQAFLQAEEEYGLAPGRGLVYWASPLTIDVDTGAEPVPQAVAERVSSTVQTAHIPTPPAQPALIQPTSSVAVESAPATAPPAPKPQDPGLMTRLRAWPGWNTIDRRMLNAALLKESVYEEMENDPLAIGQAKVIVSLAAATAAIGAATAGLPAMVVYMLASPLGWIAHTYVAYWVATLAFRGRIRSGGRDGLLAGFGFAGTPRIFFLLGAVPVYGPLFILMTLVWVGATTTVAAKQTLELDEPSAAAVAMASCLALFAVSVVVPSLLVELIA
jgi:hypothetical protein